MVEDLRSASDNVAQSSDSPAGKITNDDGDDTIDETHQRMEFICIVLRTRNGFRIFVSGSGKKLPTD